VFKLLDAAYDAGRSEVALKFKLVDSATCIVVSHNVQRSVVIGLLDENDVLRPCGNVTIPANHSVPDIGQLVEVSFMYYTGKAFEQPVFEGPRNDLNRDDARLDQIKRVKPANVLELEFV
jgi:bifunctional non-homologous end joining protein LigD